MSDDPSPSQGPRSSPFSGCLILSAILTIFGGLVVLYLFVGNYQNAKIDEFTQDEPTMIEEIQATPEAIKAAQTKLRSIGEAVTDGRVERILFTADELNVLIATLDEMEDFRSTTRVKRLNDRGILVEMAQPMRKGILKKGFRYLNADFLFEPEVRVRTIAFKVLDIRPVEGEIPDGFVENYRILDFFKLDPENEALRSNIASIQTVYAEEGHLVVETRLKPREPGED